MALIIEHEDTKITKKNKSFRQSCLFVLKMRSHLRFVLPILLVAAVWTVIAWQSDAGSVTVEPAVGVAGDYGTWTVTYRVGTPGISTGGGIRVQLPDSWHAGDRNSAQPLQATKPGEDHYVSTSTSREHVRLETIVEDQSDSVLIKAARRSLDGRAERYVFVVRVRVVEGRLEPGDTLSVIYGDTSQASRGMRASIIATPPEPILLAVDSTGSGHFEIHPDKPLIQSRSGPPVEVIVLGPSELVVNQPSALRVSLVDAHSNPADSFRGDIQFQILQGSAKIPESVTIEGAHGTAEIVPSSTGILRIGASAQGRTLEARSNPMMVLTRESDRKTYWGDLHSHTEYSWDGVGSRSFQYARFIAALNFYAMTDHSRTSDDGYTRGLGPHVWEEYTRLTDHYYEPGEFVTVHAYEASFGSPYGHHNVFFRNRPGPLLSPGNVTLPHLWQSLTNGEALTIPHHTGKMPRPVRWDVHDPEFRRNFEIYSAHGLSEVFDPEHPLAFEQSDFTSPSRSVAGPQFAQDAWISGLILSTIAASDDHRAQPGKPHWGLAAVRATGLTREEIFDALYDRYTYGTTGARILLDFSIDGKPMGQQITSPGPPHLQVEAHGTDMIDWVEVLRYSKLDGSFKVIYSLRPDAPDFTWEAVDDGFREDSIYYVRLQQRGQVRDRVAMAWSSPIWVRSE